MYQEINTKLKIMKTTTKTTDELKKFLKAKAKELKSDFNDVPEWVINASAEFFDSKQPTKEQRKIEIAERFLSGSSELSTLEMIKLIENHEDKDEIIDYIEGVDVCTRYEMAFTVESFLEEINS